MTESKAVWGDIFKGSLKASVIEKYSGTHIKVETRFLEYSLFFIVSLRMYKKIIKASSLLLLRTCLFYGPMTIRRIWKHLSNLGFSR